MCELVVVNNHTFLKKTGWILINLLSQIISGQGNKKESNGTA